MSFFGYSLRGFRFDDMSETHDKHCPQVLCYGGNPRGVLFE